MKRTLILATAASLAAGLALLGAGPARSLAREDHRIYKGMPIRECRECHLGSGVQPNHAGGWNAGHRLLATKTDANCSECHDQPFCAECHFGGGVDAGLHVSTTRGPDYKPRSHRSAWGEIHPIGAFDAPDSCVRCHDPKYCADCHGRFAPEDLQFSSHRRGWSDLSAVAGGPAHATFPPDSCPTCHPNSVLPKKQWTGQHAQEARRNLPTCQACHPDGDVCLKCHSAKFGLRVNPHPDNWDDIQDRLNKAAGKRTCVKCH